MVYLEVVKYLPTYKYCLASKAILQDCLAPCQRIIADHIGSGGAASAEIVSHVYVYLSVILHVHHFVVSQFAKSTTLEGVAQTVVNRVARDHQDCFINSGNTRCQRCEDMTLLVRNFSYPLRPAAGGGGGGGGGGGSAVTAESATNTTSGTAAGRSTTNSSSTNSSEPVTNTYSLSLDADQRIRAYISFDGYRENLARAREQGQFTDDTWWKRLLNM